jgi:hypothetical protein
MREALLVLAIWLWPVVPLLLVRRARRAPCEAAPAESCWIEEVGRGAGLVYDRGQCVDDVLMEADRKAARDEFPIPKIY